MRSLHSRVSNFKKTSAVVLLVLFILSLLYVQSAAASGKNYKRIAAIGGSVTEIIYALGEQERLIARDTTSVYPKEAFSLPDVGYIRRLSPEGVLSVNPDVIIALEGSGPPETIDTLKEADIPIIFVPEGYTTDAIKKKVAFIGKAIGASEKAVLLSAKIDEEIKSIASKIETAKKSQKVLFVLSLQGGKVLASGKNTAANGIITLAGANNVISEFEGYKQISDEAVICSKPDAILMMKRRGNHSQSDADILAHPAIATTPAGQNKNIIRMDGAYLLGFGPRTASAISDLYNSLAIKN